VLRKTVLAIGCALTGAGLVASIAVGASMLPLVILPGLLVIVLLCERFLYKPILDVPPGAGWQRTPERFQDPKSGRIIVVFYNPRTGERRYVAETSETGG
jgi:hypothetical protein